MRIGTGRHFFERFIPPNDGRSPQSLFTSSITPVRRLIRRTDPTQFLIYTDGACLDNGSRSPRAGCAFMFESHKTGCVSFRLENKGPTGLQPPKQTSNRAELRAIIAALRYRYWKGEGCNSLVIATDSEHVVEGATNWGRDWVRRDWKTADTGEPVKNQDLWRVLFGEAERWSEEGMNIKFWRIPRNLNRIADKRAKEAAKMEEVDEFIDREGI